MFETWCTEGPWSPSVSTASADSASPSSSPSSETPGGLEPERGSAAARWKKYGQKKSFQETKRNPILGFQEILSRNRRNPNLRFPGPPMVTAAVAWRTLALGHSARAPTLKSQPLAQLSPTPATFWRLQSPSASGLMLTCAARFPFPGTVSRCMHKPCQGERLQDCFCQSMSLSENVSERLSESASESAFKSDETMARLS